MENKDPFTKFMVDENEPLDKKLVAELIEPFVESIGKNKVVEYTEKFDKSPAWMKTSVYLCVRKVLLDQKIVEKEEVGPKEIAEDTGISEGSAKDISRDKKLKSIISKKGRNYFIPNHKLNRVKKLLQENEKSK